VILFLCLDPIKFMPRLISLFGLVVMMVCAWLISSNRRRVPWRVIGGGVALQFVLAAFLLRSPMMNRADGPLAAFNRGFNALIDHVDVGAEFLFGPLPQQIPFAFRVLPTIIFFSALMSLLYHVRILPWVVQILSGLMCRTLGTSGAETLSAAANIFAGQTESPLIVRPYLERMTDSELMAVMVCGYASIAGGVMAAYVSMGFDAGHLLTASLMSAPAGLLIAKILEPETGTPVTGGGEPIPIERTTVNVLDAVAVGAADGLTLALNIGAMLIAFLALIALAESGLAAAGGLFGQEWSLATGLGYLFAPFAWLMGVETNDVFEVGELIGLRMATNEFIAYEKLAEWLKPESAVQLSSRSQIIATYALCGFANLGSIGVQIGGLSALVPSRRADLARLAFRGMLGGTLACFMTACVVGILL
jgi:CNT family concentrative nucleoside transporter